MQDLNKLHKEIIEKIKKFEELNQGEQERKLKYLVAQSLRFYRATKQLTQDQLATKLGVNRIQIIRWEQGHSKPNRLVMKLLIDQGIVDKGILVDSDK